MRMFGRMLVSAPVPTVRKFGASEAVYRLGDMGHVVRPGLDQRRLPSLRAVSFGGADPSKNEERLPDAPNSPARTLFRGLRARTRITSRALSAMANTASPKTAQAAVKQTAKVIEEQSRKIADTSRELKHSSARIEDSADRTTVLAADRNVLASERTYAAWVRTGLLALAGGIGTQALKEVPNWLVLVRRATPF
jgi:hypothetical protein